MAQTVMITGCSSGFGKAAALQFMQAGWNVVATMRNPSRWDGGEHPNLLVAPLDVTDPDSIETGIKAAIGRFGRVDCLVSNAGEGLFSVFEATPMTKIRSLFETNLFGPMLLTRVLLPHFRENSGGRIVAVTSASAIVPEPLMAAYTATKSALDGFFETLQYELMSDNIDIKLIEPGLVTNTKLLEKTQAVFQSIPVPPTQTIC